MLFFQNIPPSPLPQSPKVCSVHLCLFFCFAYRVIITIFLNSIYICVSILHWSLSFWLTSLCIMGSSFIHLIHTEEIRSERDMYTPMFIAALFIIAGHGSNLDAHQQTNGKGSCGTYTPWNITQPLKGIHLNQF